MTPLLSPAGRSALGATLARGPLLVLDFDGTLAPFTTDRAEAQMRASTRDLLRVVALLHPCAVVSGRTRSDVARRLEGVPLAAIVGNHGAEPGFGPVDRALRETVAPWVPAVAAALAGERGVEVEDKRLSIAVHYRRAPEHASARLAALTAARALPGARIFDGHLVVNAVPEDAPGKGDAVAALLERLGLREAIYVGDDATDEDAFGARGVSLAVRVGPSPASAAPYVLDRQEDVDELLSEIVAASVPADRLAPSPDRLVRALARP